MVRFLLLAGLLLALAPAARAASCVQVDRDRDSLSPDEQKAAQVLLEQALSAAGRAVSPGAGCDETWTVTHARLGESVTVILSSGGRSEQLTVARLEELPAAYERLVRAIVQDSSAAEAVDRDTVTSAEDSPRRREADSLVYAQLGGGVLVGSPPSLEPTLGFGYRYELDGFIADIGFFKFTFPDEDSWDDEGGQSFSFVELNGLYVADGQADSSLYMGGGLGLGGTGWNGDAGVGLQLQGTLGYEFFRTTTIRLFPQVDVVIPLYTTEAMGHWTPSFRASVGFAFWRPERRRGWL